MKNPEFRDRLEQLVGDQAPFTWAARVGISNGAFTRIWNEGTYPKAEHLIKICLHTEASLDWLVMGVGRPPDAAMKIDGLKRDLQLAMLSDEDSKADQLRLQIAEREAAYIKSHPNAEQNSDVIHAAFELVPRHDVEVSGGAGQVISSEQIVDYFAFNKAWLRRRGLRRDNLVLVEVVGDSMSPVLVSGDTVLVDMSQTDLKTGEAYVLRIGDELVVKYAQRLPGNKIRVSSENDRMYPAFEIDLASLDGEISVIGRVVNSSRNW